MVEETPDAEARTERPSVVTTAGLLLLTLPVVGVIGMVLAVIAVSAAQDAADGLVAQLVSDGVTEGQRLVDDMLSAMWLQLGVNAVISLGQAIGLGVLAFFVLRGSRRARRIVFVLAGLSAVAILWLGALTVALYRLRSDLDTLADQIGFRMVYETDLIPGWSQPASYGLLAVSTLMILAAVWLLTRPAADTYFGGGRLSLPSPSRSPVRFALWMVVALVVLVVPVAGLSALPELPDVPKLPVMPSLPVIPSLPGMPSVPGMPSLPSVPGMPDLPNLPGVPSPPGAFRLP